MNKLKKSAIILVITLIASMLPLPAIAESTSSSPLDFTQPIGVGYPAESGNGWTWDSTSSTLTLSGIFVNDEDSYIRLPADSHIVIKEGTVNTISGAYYGIYCPGELSITGSGELNVHGITAPGLSIMGDDDKNLSINIDDLEISTDWFENPGNVTVQNCKDLTVQGGIACGAGLQILSCDNVSVSGVGINAKKQITIDDCKNVSAISSYDYYYGICGEMGADNSTCSVQISNCDNVIADGYNCGICAYGDIDIYNCGSIKVTSPYGNGIAAGVDGSYANYCSYEGEIDATLQIDNCNDVNVSSAGWDSGLLSDKDIIISNCNKISINDIISLGNVLISNSSLDIGNILCDSVRMTSCDSISVIEGISTEKHTLIDNCNIKVSVMDSLGSVEMTSCDNISVIGIVAKEHTLIDGCKIVNISSISDMSNSPDYSYINSYVQISSCDSVTINYGINVNGEININYCNSVNITSLNNSSLSAGTDFEGNNENKSVNIENCNDVVISDGITAIGGINILYCPHMVELCSGGVSIFALYGDISITGSNLTAHGKMGGITLGNDGLGNIIINNSTVDASTDSGQGFAIWTENANSKIYINDCNIVNPIGGRVLDYSFDSNTCGQAITGDSDIDLITDLAQVASKVLIEPVTTPSITPTPTETASDTPTSTLTDTPMDIPTPTAAPTPTPTILLGDTTGDGKITSADALKILHAISGKVVLTDIQKIVADVTKNGLVQPSDALKVLQYCSGKISEF